MMLQALCLSKPLPERDTIGHSVAAQQKLKSGQRILQHLRATNSSVWVARNKNPTIVGGVPAGDDTAPYLAYIDVSFARGNVVCSGTIIAADRILTSAQCFFDVDGNHDFEGVTVWGGVKNVQDFSNENYANVWGASAVDIDRRFHIEDFPNFGVAIVTVDVDSFPEGLKVANLAKRGLNNKENSFAAGYGATSESGTEPQFLQEVDLKARTFKKCAKAEGGVDHLYKNSIQCASAPSFKKGGKSPCLNDIGGPLFKKENGMTKRKENGFTVYGITAFNDVCGKPGRGAWFQKVSFFQKRIQAHISVGRANSPIKEDWLKIY